MLSALDKWLCEQPEKYREELLAHVDEIIDELARVLPGDPIGQGVVTLLVSEFYGRQAKLTSVLLHYEGTKQ